MSYKQLFLLILTIWSAELFTRFLFDMVIPPQMEYRTVYMEKDSQKGMFLGSSLQDFGKRGWQLESRRLQRRGFNKHRPMTGKDRAKTVYSGLNLLVAPPTNF